MQNSGCHGNQKKKLKKSSFKELELRYLKHLLLGIYEGCSNKSPGVKIVIDFPYKYVYRKNLKNLLF
jgi:hypothetical protein